MDGSVQRRFRLLVAKYLENVCTVVELEELFDIIREHADDSELAEIIDLAAGTIHQRDTTVPVATSQSILAAVKERQATAGAPQEARKARGSKFPFLRIAAALLIAVVCLTLLYFALRQSQYTTVRTAYGEIKEVILPDRSVVTLNANSVLRYDPDPGRTPVREVFISGEAFFQVVHHDNNQKFVVHTSNNVSIEVVGTEFNVNERRSRTRVVLHSGKILLDIREADGHKGIVMRSGEYVEVSNDDVHVVRKQVDSNLYMSWKNKQLVFVDTPLRDIITVLEDSYGFSARVNDPQILDERFTATYPSDKIEVLIRALEKSFAIRSDTAGRTITIGE